jgi:hypothetical protein
MRLALHTTFAARKKEPLAAMLNRLHQAFVDAGLGEPRLGLLSVTRHLRVVSPVSIEC